MARHHKEAGVTVGVAVVGALVAVGIATATLTAGSPVVRREARRVATEVDDWIATLLRTTAASEGTYWSLNRNTDGSGLSYGILQWTQRSGSLGRVLEVMHRFDPVLFAARFGPNWQGLLALTATPSLNPLDGALLWDEPWASRFVAAGHDVVFQAAQRYEASQGPSLQAAKRIATSLGVATERALALYFDRAVQQGHNGAPAIAAQLATDYATGAVPRPADPQVLIDYALRCAGRFRSTVVRANGTPFGTTGNKWYMLTPGAPEYRLGARGGLVQVVPPMAVGHVVAPGGVDLWDNVLKRSAGILTDPKLRDLPVNLG